jgi:two-component system, NarL family, invasion response regulator UvrY
MIRMLIVDDHQIVRHGLKEVFAEAFPELEVDEAENSRTAFELLIKKEWDLVLVDLNIPGRNGLEVVEEVKRLRPQTPVLVLSVYPEEEFAVRAFKVGASGYLNKSLRSDEILAATKKVLAGGKYVTASLAEQLATSLGGDVHQPPHDRLSGRELQVLRMVASGQAIKEIAAELTLSEKTVGTYRSRIAKKLGLNSNVELTRFALKHRLVD